MAEHFISQLPRFSDHDLEEGAECVICQQEYELPTPGAVIPTQEIEEKAIRLPCSHIVGSDCITRWLADEG